MKKTTALVLALICILGLAGCNKIGTETDLRESFPEYYNLDTFKGIEVYVWQTEGGEYRCGALSGTNRNKTFEEISELVRNGATIEKMRSILSSYDIEKEGIFIVPITVTSSDYEIINTDFDKIEDIFWGVSVLELTIAETLPSCVAFQYREPDKPYCLYAYDSAGHLYRVLWTEWDGLNEKDRIEVEYFDLKELDQTNPPGGWSPKYEISAIKVNKQ